MTITLPGELNEFLRAKVAAGRYRSVGEAVCEAVQLLRQSTDREDLLRKLDEGLDQLGERMGFLLQVGGGFRIGL